MHRCQWHLTRRGAQRDTHTHTHTQLSTLPRNTRPHARVRQALCYEKQGAPCSVLCEFFRGLQKRRRKAERVLVYPLRLGNVSFLTSSLREETITFVKESCKPPLAGRKPTQNYSWLFIQRLFSKRYWAPASETENDGGAIHEFQTFDAI